MALSFELNNKIIKNLVYKNAKTTLALFLIRVIFYKTLYVGEIIFKLSIRLKQI